MKLPTSVGRKYKASTLVSNVVCASSTSGLTLSSTINDLCCKLGMMPMPETIQQHANESVGCLFSHFSPLQRHPIEVHLAGLPVYESLRDIAAMHKKDIWTLSDAAGAGGTPLPDDLTPRTKQLIIEAINKAGMTPAISEYRRRHTMSGAKDLYRAITTATYSAYSVADEEVEEMHGSGGMGSEWKTNEVLRVLTIDEGFEVGWPADSKGRERRLFVRRDYDRIFDAVFKPTTTGNASGVVGERAFVSKGEAFITGTPGIGKTYMSSYFLWRLLSLNEVEGLRYVMYSAWGTDYIFDKMNRIATRYRYDEYGYAQEDFIREEEYGIILRDCSDNHPVPTWPSIPSIIVCPPDAPQYERHYKYGTNGLCYLANVWEAPELCAWSLCMGLSWSDVKVWYKAIGAMPRYLVSKSSYEIRLRDVISGLNSIEASPDCVIMPSNSVELTHLLMKMSGTTIDDCVREFHSDFIDNAFTAKCWKIGSRHFKGKPRQLSASEYSKAVVEAFVYLCGDPQLIRIMLKKCKGLVDTQGSEEADDETSARDSKNDVGLHKVLEAMEADMTLPREQLPWNEKDSTHLAPGILYVPENTSRLPLVDTFMLIDDVFICIKATTKPIRRNLDDSLFGFKGMYNAMGISPKHKVIVYVQPTSASHITTVQWPSDECDDAGLLAFWSEFRQYQFTADDEFSKAIMNEDETA